MRARDDVVNERDRRQNRGSERVMHYSGSKLFAALLLNGVYTPACGVRRSRAFVCTCLCVCVRARVCTCRAMIYCSSERRQRCEVQRD